MLHTAASKARRAARRAFSLVELLVVLVIIAIISAIVYADFGSLFGSAEETSLEQTAGSFDRNVRALAQVDLEPVFDGEGEVGEPYEESSYIEVVVANDMPDNATVTIEEGGASAGDDGWVSLTLDNIDDYTAYIGFAEGVDGARQPADLDEISATTPSDLDGEENGEFGFVVIENP